MTKEEYNKYKHKVLFFYNVLPRFEVSCIFCAECREYKRSSLFPQHGLVNEYKLGACLCTECYTKKHKLTQDFFEDVLHTSECSVCHELKKYAGYRNSDFNKYRKQKWGVCNTCHEKERDANKLKKNASSLLKSQGITNITEETIKTKELTLLIKRQIKNEKEGKINPLIRGSYRKSDYKRYKEKE